MITWLIEGGIGPALVALPVNWTAAQGADIARNWFQRFRRSDDLSRLVTAATGTSAGLTRAEFAAVRDLLGDQRTWNVAGRGTVEDLAGRIGSCLPVHAGRTAHDAHAAAMAIARGLLEFGVADLDPQLFQRVLLARLQRLETDQASALDAAMLSLHADLLSGLASMSGQVRQVLARLPPGPATTPEVSAYLRALIGWLSSDPWPRDRRFGGQVLTPVTLERKLRVVDGSRADGPDLDADVLARHASRLVILGGPGSGKTWLAKRTARRCAEEALTALAAEKPLDEVELPMYVRCSDLLAADGDIREAVAACALNQLGDLGGSRVTAALRLFFTGRNAPTLLVIDSLDEARGSDDRLRQADTLSWRIILTTRPSSWNHQIVIKEETESHTAGELQPLRYPEDVEPFIVAWFAGQPELARTLTGQVARQPWLQRGASVPLILAFYCILGTSEPLPQFRRDLYAKVLNRMLTGRWRSSRTYRPDLEGCHRMLRAWAWSGAVSSPVSGMGMWHDDIPVTSDHLGEADLEALEHVAPALGPSDIDTGTTLRRFVHRSIREHLVAEHVADLPVDEAASALIPHIWYDSDWEYAAPAAIARHPDRDELVRQLICRVSGTDQIAGDPPATDAGWEFRKLLARVAAESHPSDWSSGNAEIISQARLDLAFSDRAGDLGGAVSWVDSDRRVRDVLVWLLARETDSWLPPRRARLLIRLNPTAEDRHQARAVLVRLLASARIGDMARTAADLLAQFAIAPEEKQESRAALLGLLVNQSSAWTGVHLAAGLAALDPSERDKKQARAVLFRLLDDQVNASAAESLAGGLAGLDPTEQEKQWARARLLERLAAEGNARAGGDLAAGLAALDPSDRDKEQARTVLFRLLDDQANSSAAGRLATGLARLDPTEQERQQASALLLGQLAAQDDVGAATRLADALAALDPADRDKGQARTAALRLLSREALLSRMGLEAANGPTAARLAERLVQLDPTEPERQQARHALLSLAARETPLGILVLVIQVIGLATTEHEKRQACADLLELLDNQVHAQSAAPLASPGILYLDPTAQDKQRACHALVRLLARTTSAAAAARLADALARLDPIEGDKRQARQALLGLLAGQTGTSTAAGLADALARLDPIEDDKRQARQALLGLLAGQTDADQLAAAMTKLSPTVHDLGPWSLATWCERAVNFQTDLLTAVRQNSTVTDWLSALSR